MKPKKSSDSEFFETVNTPFGNLYIIFMGDVLTVVSFEDDKPRGILPGKSGASDLVRKQLDEYLRGERTDFTCQTAFSEGTEFERNVWNALRKVPYGETRTYKWLAEKIGKPRAFRAVGNALGKNPIPIIIPCHRIIESDGSLGGYSSGIGIKRRLLEIEYYAKLSSLKNR
jgi:methylated-DNA-[protein]-cysteine S-methyltransferase